MSSYKELTSRIAKIADVYSAVALMHWDNEVYMPAGGAAIRSRQISTLTGMAHELFTSSDLGSLMDKLLMSDDLEQNERRNVELLKLDFDKQIKLDKSFVEQFSAATSKAFGNWTRARAKDDFSIFSDSLDELIKLKRKETELRGYENEPYDTLLDLYEPGLTTQTLDRVFTQAKQEIVPFLKDLMSKDQPQSDFLSKFYNKDVQWDFGIDVLKAMGYDMNCGRQDISAHPFTISFDPTDVRVTTRIDEHDFLNMAWSCIHEGGHALYEQGLDPKQYGMPLGSAVSLSIHESQSRLWENHVGRSLDFWQHWYPILQRRFPENLSNISLDTFYRGINKIEPNLIRTEADELHYHLHVIIRYEIERACINGEIEAKELPQIWNEKYKAYMNVDVPSDANGILQDVHWSHGSFGYFPTYTLGSFYAAQFFKKAEGSIVDLDKQVQNGDYSALLQWLRTNIHQHGRKYDPEVLCERVTGEKLNVKYFMDYAKAKFQNVYAS